MTDQRDRIVLTLTAEDSPLRSEAASLVVDHVLSLPLRDLVDARQVHAIVVSALTETNVLRAVEAHVAPGWKRYSAHVARSGDTVGSLVPESAQEKLRKIAAAGRAPRGASGVLDPSLLGRLFAPVWSQVLLAFVRKLPLPGIGAATAASEAVGKGAFGLAGKLTQKVQERAERIVDAGRSVMGGLGAELEKRVQAATREFADGATTLFQDAVRERLASPEGRDITLQLAEHAVNRVLAMKLSDVHQDAERLRLDAGLELAPTILPHAARKPVMSTFIDGEISAFLAVEGDRPVRDVLAELGVFDVTRTAAIVALTERARGFFQTDAFADWLGRLLDV